MRRASLILAAVIAAWGAAPRGASAVELALVLLNDVSRSMDEGEYQLVKAGYRSAFSDPDVIAALLGNGGGVAVAYVAFSGKREVVLVKRRSGVDSRRVSDLNSWPGRKWSKKKNEPW